MQTDWKEIYKKTSERTGKPQELYKDVGNFVFKGLKEALKRPPKLILRLRGIGYWYLRKKRLEIVVDNLHKDYKDYDPVTRAEQIETVEIFQERLKDYIEWSGKKAEIKRKRNEFKTLLQPTDGKVESSEASQADSS